MMIFNKFIFNWNVVALLDPDYMKYLVGVNDVANRRHTDVTDILPHPIENDPIGNTNYRDYRLKGRTNEELEIIKMMHNDNLSETKIPEVPINGNMQNFDAIDFQDINLSNKDSDKIQECQFYNRILELKYEYMNHRAPINVNPLQLLPPKCVLDEGSSIYIGDGNMVHYKITHSQYLGRRFKVLLKSKISEKDGMLRLIKASYFFHPKKNIVSDMKSGFTCLSYNIKTRALYKITKEPRDKRANKRSRRYKGLIHRISLDSRTMGGCVESINHRILLKFVLKLYEIVKRDVPDVFLPGIGQLKKGWVEINHKVQPKTSRIAFSQEGLALLNESEIKDVLRYYIILLNLQHRIGKRIDWLDKGLLKRIISITNTDEFMDRISYNPTAYSWVEFQRIVKRKRYRRLGKVVPNLKKHTNFTCLVESAFGKFYHKMLLKLMPLDIPTHLLLHILKWLLNDIKMPKFIYHWLTVILKISNIDLKVELTKVVAGMLSDISLNTNGTMSPNKYELNAIKSYIKTTNRHLETIPDTNTYIPVQWHTWRDIFRMANALNIRIRPNKFNSTDDIIHLHDKLAELENRDLRSVVKYKGKEFEYFEHPNKEYGDGFRFVWLGKPEDLVEEGRVMHHYVGGYVDRCMEGYSIIFSMRKGERGYITIELDGKTRDYDIIQQYTIKDFTIRNESILKMINEWHEDVLEMHREDSTVYHRLCENRITKIKLEISIKELEDYLTELGLNDPMEIKPSIEAKLASAKQNLQTLIAEENMKKIETKTDDMITVSNAFRCALMEV